MMTKSLVATLTAHHDDCPSSGEKRDCGCHESLPPIEPIDEVAHACPRPASLVEYCTLDQRHDASGIAAFDERSEMAGMVQSVDRIVMSLMRVTRSAKAAYVKAYPGTF